LSHPNPEALLEHVGFLRAIALGLLRNEADAEDVVQQTLVAAMEKPPADDRNLKGWLGAVARNFALMQFRSRKRRHEREAKVARAEGGPSTADITERLEMEKRVVDAVATLEEPFRTTLILRYYDNLSPKQIAAHLGIPDATVRTRLKRGLDKMRGDLEKRSGGRRPMLAGLLLLAQLPAQAASPWPARMVGAGGIAAVFVGIVAVGWLVRQDRTEPRPERAEPTRNVRADPDVPDPPTKLATLSGRVVDERRQPIALAEVIVIPHEGLGRLDTPERRIARWLGRPKPLARTKTNRRGEYAFGLTPNRPVWIVARKRGRTLDAFPLIDTSGSYVGVDLMLRRAELYAGRILDWKGAPLSGIYVHGWDSRFHMDFAPVLSWDRTDAEGRFELPLAEKIVLDGRERQFMPRVLKHPPRDGQISLVRGRPGGVVAETETRAILLTEDQFDVREADARGVIRWSDSPGGPMQVILLHDGHEPRRVTWPGEDVRPGPLEEAVLYEGKAPVGGAEIGVWPTHPLVSFAMFGFDCLHTVRARDDGSYAIRGRGTVVMAHPRLSPRLSPLDDQRASRSVEGKVVDATGKPVAGARVMAAPLTSDLLWIGHYLRQAGNWVGVSRADGSFVIPYLPSGQLDQFKLVCVHPGRGLTNESDHAATTLRMERVDDEELPHWSFPVTPAFKPVGRLPSKFTIEGRVVSKHQHSIQGATVEVEGLPTLVDSTDDNGEFLLPVVWKKDYVLLVRKNGVGSGRFEGVDTRHFVTLSIPQWVAFEGRVLFGGKPVAGAFVRSFVAGRLLEEGNTDKNGRFEFMCTPFHREFSISVNHPEYLSAWWENPLEGDFELQRATGVRIRVVDDLGRARPGVELVVDKQRRRSSLEGFVDVVRRSKDGMQIGLAPTGQDLIIAKPVSWSEDGALATVHVRRGLRIEGEVRDLKNRPVAHTLVLAEPTKKGVATRRAFTNSRGRFVLRTLHPVRYRLRVAEQEAAHEFEAGTKNVLLRKEKE
jgi:RNA polymerase sigma-70 factor (ECF subfamily)